MMTSERPETTPPDAILRTTFGSAQVGRTTGNIDIHTLAQHATCDADCEIHRFGDRVLSVLAEHEALERLP
jgi:hypothetical protein